MKKIINKSLLKSIINSDFFFIKKDSLKNNIYSDKRIHITKSKTLSSLCLIELLKSLKQFIRLLQFVKKTNAFLNINIENKQQYFLLKQFLIENKLDINVNINNTISSNKSDSSLENTKVLLILGSDIFINRKQLLKKVNIEKNFLFLKVNTNIENNNFGIYKIFNDIFDFKKIVFIILLINQILKKNI